MRGIDLLFDKAERNRRKYYSAMDDIGSAAHAKFSECSSVFCERDESMNSYILTIFFANGKSIKVDAMDFFDKFGNKKNLSMDNLYGLKTL